MMRCLQCGTLVGQCTHVGPTYDDGARPGPEGQLLVGAAAALVAVAFVVVLWYLAVMAR